MANIETVKDRVGRFCKREGFEVGSNMTRGLFVVSRPTPQGMLAQLSRHYHLAFYDSKNKTVRMVAGPFDLINDARSEMRFALAERGISPKTPADTMLHGLPSFPCNALDPW